MMFNVFITVLAIVSIVITIADYLWMKISEKLDLAIVRRRRKHCFDVSRKRRLREPGISERILKNKKSKSLWSIYELMNEPYKCNLIRWGISFVMKVALATCIWAVCISGRTLHNPIINGFGNAIPFWLPGVMLILLVILYEDISFWLSMDIIEDVLKLLKSKKKEIDELNKVLNYSWRENMIYLMMLIYLDLEAFMFNHKEIRVLATGLGTVLSLAGIVNVIFVFLEIRHMKKYRPEMFKYPGKTRSMTKKQYLTRIKASYKELCNRYDNENPKAVDGIKTWKEIKILIGKYISALEDTYTNEQYDVKLYKKTGAALYGMCVRIIWSRKKYINSEGGAEEKESEGAEANKVQNKSDSNAVQKNLESNAVQKNPDSNVVQNNSDSNSHKNNRNSDEIQKNLRDEESWRSVHMLSKMEYSLRDMFTKVDKEQEEKNRVNRLEEFDIEQLENFGETVKNVDKMMESVDIDEDDRYDRKYGCSKNDAKALEAMIGEQERWDEWLKG